VSIDNKSGKRRWSIWLASLLLSFFIASCASHQSANALKGLNIDAWSGRSSVRTAGAGFEAPKQFSAGFVLTGSATKGELSLDTPLGTTLAKARWAPGMAELTQGGTTQAYANINDLTTALTGEPLPLAALFKWLQGEASTVNGWTPNLTQHAQGRISATRQQPSGDTLIRVVLDQPDK
jgi:outer membrane lipoprotein LolB